MCRSNASIFPPFAWLILCSVVVSSGVCGQEVPIESHSQINEVDQLSDRSFAERQQATLEMWRVRDQSREQVQQAAKHSDPEVAGRAQWILRQWRKGSLPGTPPEISRLLAKNPGPAGIGQLLLEGQFAAATVAVEESAGTVEFESIQQRVHLNLLRRFPTYVHAAMKYQRLPELLDFIDTVASSKEVAVTRAQLMLELGIDIDTEGLLPKSADTWTASERIQAEALVLMVLGRIDQAIEVAETGSDRQFAYLCRASAGRWEDAMSDALTAAKNAEPRSVEHARFWSQVMICADRAGDREVFRQAAEQLANADMNDGSSARDLRWRTLASHGELDLAIRMLDKLDRESAAAVAVSASRMEHAFNILGFPLDQIDSQIDAWTDNAISAQQTIFDRDPKLSELAEPVNDLLMLVRCLIMIGREDLARSVFQRLCDSDVRVGNLKLRDHVLDSLRLTSRSDWIPQFAIAEGEKTLSPIVKNIIARSLPDADTTSLELVIEALKLTNRGQTTKQRILDACALMAGELPGDIDGPTYYKKLHDIAIMPGRAAGRRLANRRPAFVTPRIRANMKLVRFFLRHSQAEHATAIIQKLAETGDQQALLLLAEQELDAGSTELAQALFESLSESVFGGLSGVRLVTISGDELAVKSLIGEWAVTRRHGDEDRAAQLNRQIRISLFSPSTNLRSAIAEYLVERNEREPAIDVYQGLLPMAMLGNEERTGIYDVARSYALLVEKTNVDDASRWYDLAVCEVVRNGNFRPGAYVSVPLYVRRWSVRAAIEQKDGAAMQRHIERIMRLDPLDIALAESILPEMRQAGFAELADQTLDQIMEIGGDYCRQFPDDATRANNLAWVAAMNDKHLETALQLSQRAVYREPESAIYRDTLAEILFRLDRPTEALQVEEACLLDDATQWHLHKQVKKYREAAGG